MAVHEAHAEGETLFGILSQVDINTTVDDIVIIVKKSMEEGIDVAASKNHGIGVFLQ